LYINKASVLRHQGKYNDALANLDAAYNIDNLKFQDENHVYFARILLEQGRTYLDKKSEAAQAHLKEALQIYDNQPIRNLKQHAASAEALGRYYLEYDFLRDAIEMFQVAMDIRTAIYGNSHPEIAETLYSQAQVNLKMAEVSENEGSKTEAHQMLKKALNILQQYSEDNAELISKIERTLANL
jgi:tetratricopeptide (TPR) repeat protein